MQEIKIICIKDLIKMDNLQIPIYQRPYKWKEKNVNQLIDDILFHKNKIGYRLGTLVLHKDKEIFNIVDGQQRVITIFLLAHALKLDFTEKLEKLTANIINNNISKNNIKINYNLIQKRIKEFDDKSIKFFFEKCQFVKIVLENVEEAFQFFDSQNARGKELSPHDLLKAFHLREMNNYSTEEERIKAVEGWENLGSDNLNSLFSNLFKIKKWSKGDSAYYFTKEDIDIFKGVTIEEQNYPFIKPLQINNYFVNKQNEHDIIRINNRYFNYPFQIDQPIINGKRFFEMVIYYNNLIKDIKDIKNDILDTLDNYEGRYRTGDGYVRNLFDCALIYYIDKFGKIDLEKAIEKLFVWAYSLRLEKYAVKLNSVDNHAKEKKSIFGKLHYAINHNEILKFNLNSIKKVIENEKELELEKVAKKILKLDLNSIKKLIENEEELEMKVEEKEINKRKVANIEELECLFYKLGYLDIIIRMEDKERIKIIKY